MSCNVELALNVAGISGDHLKAEATVLSCKGFSWTSTDPRVRADLNRVVNLALNFKPLLNLPRVVGGIVIRSQIPAQNKCCTSVHQHVES